VADVTTRLARLRVPLGFLAGVVVLVLARPTLTTLAAGTVVAMLGEAVRVWAAGHLEKSREVTRSGPYRWHRHPLYVGSTVMGVGIGIAAASLPAAALILLYLGTTYTAAIRTEEAFLRSAFGPAYDDYCAGRLPAVDRPFDWARVWRNKEWRSVLGGGLVFLVLAAKAYWMARLP
jgi:protein-S-isoprenylcysteine O-methyltransferase Ste14